MLDIIETALKSNQIKYTRYDGAMSRNERQASIDDFISSPRIPAMLVSLKV
jgi:SNF2 family DNA or RNA helicase